jgi:hypothetical protein
MCTVQVSKYSVEYAAQYLASEYLVPAILPRASCPVRGRLSACDFVRPALDASSALTGVRWTGLDLTWTVFDLIWFGLSIGDWYVPLMSVSRSVS